MVHCSFIPQKHPQPVESSSVSLDCRQICKSFTHHWTQHLHDCHRVPSLNVTFMSKFCSSFYLKVWLLDVTVEVSLKCCFCRVESSGRALCLACSSVCVELALRGARSNHCERTADGQRLAPLLSSRSQERILCVRPFFLAAVFMRRNVQAGVFWRAICH